MIAAARPRPWRDRVVVRLIVSALAAGIVATAIGTILLDRSGRSELRESLLEEHRSVARELASRLDGRVDQNLVALRLLASREALVPAGARVVNELQTALRATSAFDEVVVYDGAGRPVAAAASRFLADVDDYDARPDLVAGTQVDSSIAVAAANPPVLEIAVAIEDPPGTQVGVLVARTPLEVVASPVQQARPAGEPVRFLVAAGGRVLVHPNRDRVVDGVVFDLEPLLPLPGEGRVQIGGRDHLVAAAPLERFAAAVVLQQTEASALAPVEDRIRELLAILVAVLATAVLAISIVGGVLLRPLTPLAAAVNDLGRGVRRDPVEVQGAGEVRTLAEQFNRLRASLARRENEVAELQRVSLLVHGHAARPDLYSEMARGAHALLDAAGAAVWERADDGVAPTPVATSGAPPRSREAGRVVDAALRLGAPQAAVDAVDGVDGLEPDRACAVVAVPIAASTGDPRAVIVVEREGEAWQDGEVLLAEALGAVAGVALDNVARLDLERHLADELQDAVDRRRDLIGTVTHEFRTPLTCIEGFSSMLLTRWESYDDDMRRQLIAKIHRHSEELEELVSRLLDFAVTERGTLNANLEPMDLQVAIDDALAGLAPLLGPRVVDCDVPSTVVVADVLLLRRTMTNLVSNAVKYSPAEAPISVVAIEGDATVRIEVVDHGAGLSPKEAAMAFRPFWRAGNAATRGKRGAGIGLSLVAEYVRVMGGQTGVLSEPGRGSTFFFTLNRPPAVGR